MMFRERFRINCQHIVLAMLVVILIMLFRMKHQVLNLPTEQKSAEKPIRTENKQPPSKGVQNVYLIPDDTTLQGMTENELYLVFWRYANTFQTLCQNTMRFGPLNDRGKDVCIDEEYVPHKPCLVYSLGSKLEFQFEETVLKVYGCEVHTFDPSIKITDANRKKIPKDVTYHEIGIDGKDFVNDQGWKMQTLPSMIKDLQHENRVIDILKMDAEGGEWSGFQDESNFKGLENVKQLLVEFHFGRQKDNSLWGNVNFANQLKVFRTLYEKGFRICLRQRAGWHRQLKSPYGPDIDSFSEISLLNLKWKRQK